jgi:hypothetical protein
MEESEKVGVPVAVRRCTDIIIRRLSVSSWTITMIFDNYFLDS